MLIGHDILIENFKNKKKLGILSHAYIFFGEPQVGKKALAMHLANYLENDNFSYPEKILSETLEINPQKEGVSESIGIDEIRKIKDFIYQRPISSSHRLAIIDEADLMTDQAQHAILKIAEEPSEHAILILIVSNPDALIKTVQSRFQKIYFPRLSEKEITKMLVNEYSLKENEATEISKLSFGRPGRAIDLINNKDTKDIRDMVRGFLDNKISLKDILSDLADIENKHKISPFLTELIVELRKNVNSNYKALKSVLHRTQMLSEWNVNRKMQLEACLTEVKEYA